MDSSLIVKTQIGDSFAEEYSDRIQCLDPVNGQVTWSIGQDAINITDPIYSDNVVYFGAVTGVMESKLYAVGIETGQAIWDIEMAFTNVRSRPYITDDWVIFGCTHGQVIALDKESGQVKFKFESDCYESSVDQIFVIDNRVVACSYTGQIFACSLDDQHIIWESELPDDDFFRIMTNGKVNMLGRFIVAAIQEIWPKGASIPYEEDMDLTHEIWVIDSEDGQITGPFGPYDEGAIFITKDYIYSLVETETSGDVGLNSAELQLREWDESKEEFIGKKKTIIPNISALSDILIGPNRLFGCDFEHLYAFDLAKCEMSWIIQDTDLASGTPMQLISNLLFVMTTGNTGDDLFCLDANTGRLLWNYPNILDVAASIQ